MFTACGIMHPRCCQSVAWKLRTQTSAPDDGRDHRPKHVELISIINKPLLLYLVGVYITYMFIIYIIYIFYYNVYLLN